MKISCPQCGSANIIRVPGTIDKGWNFIKAGFFIFLLSIVLPISMGPILVMAIIGALFFGIGCLFLVVVIGRGIVSSHSSDWSWECQACKKEFATAPLD